jgi:hypothetical protein
VKIVAMQWTVMHSALVGPYGAHDSAQCGASKEGQLFRNTPQGRQENPVNRIADFVDVEVGDGRWGAWHVCTRSPLPPGLSWIGANTRSMAGLAAFSAQAIHNFLRFVHRFPQGCSLSRRLLDDLPSHPLEARRSDELPMVVMARLFSSVDDNAIASSR